LTPPAIHAQGVIQTVAGNGSGTYSGDNGPATKAGLNGPSGIFIDSAGNLYVADTYNGAVRKVDTAGTITTIAGCGPTLACTVLPGGTATNTSLLPFDVVVDKAGNIYASDGGSTVFKVDTAGVIAAFAGSIGNPMFSGDGGPAAQATLDTPTGLAFDRAGNLYIVDQGNNRVRKVDTAGIISTVAGSNGTGAYSGDGGIATSATLNNPRGVAVDSDGNIYIADSDNRVVRKVDLSGTITTFAGGGLTGAGMQGVAATSIALEVPAGVAVDSAGNVYLSESIGYRIRKVDSSGIITTVAGNGMFGFSGDGGPATAAMFKIPEGIRLDASGNLYIADSTNGRIRKVSPAPAGPTLNALGVVNNASFAAGSNPVAPGSIAAVFGSNMNNGTNVLFSSFGPDGTLVTTLAGAQVTVNGTPVPIFYSTPGQLGIQIPVDLTGSSASVQVSVGGETSTAQNIPIAPAAPGLFSTDQSGHGQGAILIANTNTLAAPTGSIPGRVSRPAKPGEFITIFCTGLGALTPALATGEKGTNNTTANQPSVTIDGNSAMVEFSGIAPGFVGLYQVNVQVPAGTRTAGDIPVVVTIGGIASNTVTIAAAGN
jgi:uncharacterized protein (TIGR03437 family)